MKKIRIVILSAVLCCMAASCAESEYESVFIKTSEKGADNLYTYSVDMQDSTCVYDLSLFTKVDRSEFSSSTIPNIRLDIRLVSPSKREFEETVWILKDNFSFKEENSTDYDLPYRTGLVPVEFGVWDMYVAVPEEDKITGFRGLGLQVKKSGYGER